MSTIKHISRLLRQPFNARYAFRRLADVMHDTGRTVAVKIDVEGHESHVVDGARTFLAANRCFLQVEASADKLAGLTDQLNRLGYRHVATLSDHFFTNIPAQS